MKLNFLDESIQSVHGLPNFEDVSASNLTEKLFKNENLLKFEPSIDETGKRINSYCYCIRVSPATRLLKQRVPYKDCNPFKFQHPIRTTSTKNMRVSRKLQPNAKKNLLGIVN